MTIVGQSANNVTVIASSWNGPRCPICNRGYIGRHACTKADLRRMIDDLQGRLDELEAAATKPANDVARTCPCNPTLGGSGVCGCTLGGYKVTC